MKFLPDSQKFAATVDRPSVRIALALLIGIPIALFGIVFGYAGLAFGLDSLFHGFEIISATTVAIATFGLLGIFGGWIRLLRRHSVMGDKIRWMTVAFLWCGVASAGFLAAWFMIVKASLVSLILATVWTAMTVIGMLLIHATPAHDLR